jgi:PIN domain nuclease of toxin-antitoxin system
MASLVLDTHALVFTLQAPGRLGRRARTALQRVEAGRDQAWIPAAVLAEIVLLHELGRIGVGLPEVRIAINERANLHFLPLDLEQLDVFRGLTAVRDPFDRLIISAARCLGAQLVSRDSAVSASGLVRVVWS